MSDIMMVFACFNQSLHPTALRQLTIVAQALPATAGRVTMLGLSRWAGKGTDSIMVMQKDLFVACSRHDTII
jgi:hypothetical protein